MVEARLTGRASEPGREQRARNGTDGLSTYQHSKLKHPGRNIVSDQESTKP